MFIRGIFECRLLEGLQINFFLKTDTVATALDLTAATSQIISKEFHSVFMLMTVLQ